MPQSWFERLFKFNQLNFSEGELGFQLGQSLWMILVLGILLIAGFVVIYSITNLFTSQKSRAVSLGLRILALLLLLIPLLEPVLILPDVIPDENFVAVLIDSSESMGIEDEDGVTRYEAALSLLNDEQRGIVDEIEEFFQVRFYAFDEHPRRVDSLQYLGTEGKGTNISYALDRVIDDFNGIPLSGAILLTDGGDTSDDVPLNQAEALQSMNVPLHIIGVGSESFVQEREILEAFATRSVEETTGAEIEVKVRSWDEEQTPVTFGLYRGEERVFSETRTLKGGGKIDQFTFFFEPELPEADDYVLKIEESEEEVNLANNQVSVLIDTRKDSLKVLLLEGSLRNEFKFLRRVMEDDQVIDVASVARTGPSQFYRQVSQDPEHLAGGFPVSLEALYQYKAVILGDIEASAFSLEQLEMLEQFVRVRGGGLIMLGGRQTFAEGDYFNTSVADIIPLTIDPGRRNIIPPVFRKEDVEPEEQGFAFLPTAVGYESPILKLSPDSDVNRDLWNSMPGLTNINYLGRVKPGAVVLAEKPEDEFGASEPILAVQRYGKGRSAALMTASTWRWQMLLPAEDSRHERFWRQLIRWVVASAPDQVDVDLGASRIAPEEEIPLTVRVYDELSLPVSGSVVRGFVTDPFGSVKEISFQEDLTEQGAYLASYVPQDLGVFSLDVEARSGDRVANSKTTSFLSQASTQEYRDATLKKEFLRRLASASGGSYYSVEEASTIPDQLRGRRTSTSVYRTEYLWDMPILWGTIFLLLSIEWVYRRRMGLP